VGNGAIDLTTGAVRQGIDGAYFEPEEDVDFDDPDRWLLGALRRFSPRLPGHGELHR